MRLASQVALVVEPTCQYRRHMRHGFDPWFRKILWRRKWQPIPIFLLGESHGQRSLAGRSRKVAKSPTRLKQLSTERDLKLHM